MREQHKLWDSQRERERKRERERERENFFTKKPNLRHCWTCSQNKGLSEYRGELAGCGLAHAPPEAGRQQPELERGKLRPRDGIFHHIVSRLPVANQAFLGSWTDGIHWEHCSQISAPQKRHMAQLRQ